MGNAQAKTGIKQEPKQETDHDAKKVVDQIIDTTYDNMDDHNKKAADVMKNKLSKFKGVIYDEGVVTKSTTTIPNSFDIILQGEDYTLGKVLEYILYRDYYENKRSAEEVLRLNYCGFQKPHPHIDLSIIRVGFAEENIQADEVRNLLEVVYHTATSIFDTIDRQFMSQI